MDWKRLLPTLLTAVGALLTIAFQDFGPAIAAFIAAHPTWGGVIITVVVGLANVLNPKKS